MSGWMDGRTEEGKEEGTAVQINRTADEFTRIGCWWLLVIIDVLGGGGE